MKNKKFNYFTIVIYVLIIAALVVFVTSGNESVNKKPDELKTTDFYQLVREGLPDSYDFANGFENSKIAAVQVTEETLYGLYVPNGESESSEDFSKKLEKFKKGITLDDGYTCKEAILEIQNASDEGSEIVLTIQEGKFHQVKRMFEAVGKKVTYLKRIEFGTLPLDDDLEEGEYRELTEEEVAILKGL